MLYRILQILFLFLLIYPFGSLLGSRSISHQQNDYLESSLYGYLAISSALYFINFFSPISVPILIALLIIIIMVLYQRKFKFNSYSKDAIHIWLPSVIAVSAIASLPIMIPDDQYYHYPTIQAISQGGWIFGIANIEPRLALGSSIHVFISAAKSTVTGPLAINGLLLCLMMVQSFDRLKNGRLTIGVYWLLLIALGVPFYFLLIPSSSPDLLGLIVTASLIENEFLRKTPNRAFSAVLLALAILLKPNIALSVVLILAISLIKHRSSKCEFIRIILFLIVGSSLLIAKNIVTSGYPMFPLQVAGIELPWSVPSEALNQAMISLRHGQAGEHLVDRGVMDYFNDIFLIPSVKSLLNWVSLIGLLCIPVILLFKKWTKLWSGLALSLILLVPQWLFLNSVPNFRLGAHFLLPTFSLVLITFSNKRFTTIDPKKVIRTTQVCLGIVVLGLFLLPTIDLSKYVRNQYYDKIHTLNLANLIYPKELPRTKKYRAKSYSEAYFNLYPSYNLKYNNEKKYYYLEKKNRD